MKLIDDWLHLSHFVYKLVCMLIKSETNILILHEFACFNCNKNNMLFFCVLIYCSQSKDMSLVSFNTWVIKLFVPMFLKLDIKGVKIWSILCVTDCINNVISKKFTNSLVFLGLTVFSHWFRCNHIQITVRHCITCKSLYGIVLA